MTEDSGEQFHAVACRAYTLPREDSSSQPRGWIQGNTRIESMLEGTTSYLHGKHGVDIRIMSLSRDDTHSLVRFSHGSNKFVMNLNNETEIPEDQLEEYALKTECKRLCMPIEGKSKTTKKRTSRLFMWNRSHRERNWIDIEPGKHSLSEYEVSH